MSYEKVIVVRGEGSVDVAVVKDGVRLTGVSNNGTAVFLLNVEQVKKLIEALDTSLCYFGDTTDATHSKTR